MLPVLLTVREVAQRLKVTDSAVYAQIQKRHLRAIKITRRAIRIREADLDFYLNPAGVELTVPEVARALRLSRSEVYKLIRQRRLAALKRGGARVRVLERDLLNFIESRPDDGVDGPALENL